MYLILLVMLLYSQHLTLLAHPVHLSVTEIYPDKKSGQARISVTLFMDDFSQAIHYPSHEKQIRQGKITINELMEGYLKEKLRVRINEKAVQFKILYTENNLGAVTCYLEVEPSIKTIQQVYIENAIFLELFADQRNLVQIQWPGKKSGALSFDKNKTQGNATL